MQLSFISNILLIYSAVQQPVCLINLLTYLQYKALKLRPKALHKCSALTLLVGRQEGHPAYKKKLTGGCWLGYLSAAKCRLAYGPADATATHCLLLQ